MARVRRLIAALLLAVLACASAAPVTCSGWESTPADRMACCQRAGHTCPDQSAADACCALQEDNLPRATMSGPSLTALATPAALLSAVPDFTSLALVTCRADVASHVAGRHAPPGSFSVPLRI